MVNDLYQKHSRELSELAREAGEAHGQIEVIAQQLTEAFSSGKKVLVAGNGGSAAEAQHFSDEMVGRYRGDRPAYPVIALTADSAVLTCIGNDFGFDQIFKRQVEALGKEGDIFIGLSTSGNSKNIIMAVEEARARGMTVVAFTGPTGTLKEIADYALVVPCQTAARIQEMHLHAIHLICEAFEIAA